MPTESEIALPLEGLKILDLSRVLAGPFCCALMGEQGADVIKVERPVTGDENRRWGDLWHGESIDFMNFLQAPSKSSASIIRTLKR